MPMPEESVPRSHFAFLLSECHPAPYSMLGSLFFWDRNTDAARRDQHEETGHALFAFSYVKHPLRLRPPKYNYTPRIQAWLRDESLEDSANLPDGGTSQPRLRRQVLSLPWR
jgi:hypothetical protein